MSLLDRVMGRRVYYIGLGNDAPVSVQNYTAKELYNSQCNLQAVVSFLSESIAQLPVKTYTRISETERSRDRESPAALLLWKPNPDQTQFAFSRCLSAEYLVFGAVFVWVYKSAESASGYEMRIIPTEWVRDVKWENPYAIQSIIVQQNGGDRIEIPRSQFIPIFDYSPGNPGGYTSRIAALSQTLTEQIEAGKFRKQLWRSSGRLNAYIYRPANVQPWSEPAREKFASAFREGWSSSGSNAGKYPIMEDGMEIRSVQPNFRESQWAESVKLSREDIAAAYHINPGLIWHTEPQTYASAKDNARALYAECLGPLIQMFQQAFNAHLLPMIGADPQKTYVEFDYQEKLRGSFEERAEILQAAVGGPWMTRDEARADNNLPPLPEGLGNQIITPLNVITGGQASPKDTHMNPKEPMVDLPAESAQNGKCGCGLCKTGEIRIKGRAEPEDDQRIREVLEKFFSRQAASVIPKIGAGGEWWDKERWDQELADDLEPAIDAIADKNGTLAAEKMGTDYAAALTRAYLRKMAEARAKATNTVTQRNLQEAIDNEAMEDAPSPAAVMEIRAKTEKDMLGRTLATIVTGWAIIEAGKQAKSQGYTKKVEKEWVTGANPRGSHAAMNGQRAPLNSPFSNGAMWPGDDVLGPDETCGCNCTTEIVIS